MLSTTFVRVRSSTGHDDEQHITPPAVTIKLAYKRYGRNAIILQGLNMNVGRGTIYGLLGPSGCGKTTLLSCIVGRQRLDSGTIITAFTQKKQIGYMPQEITLSEDLTIIEILRFYGSIYNMEQKHIQKRAGELIKFLDLPPSDRLVKNCSGGQQRRISMAVTLIHEPDLLILDEPTVGVDPVLCASIWECFLKLVNEQGKTIIITTHYIEEAKNANAIGLMRGGILLAEESPLKLLEMYNCERLEEVFLKLSEKQENIEEFHQLPYPKVVKSPSPVKDDGDFKKHRFQAQLNKNITWTLRNWAVTLFVCFIPALSVIICCSNDIDNLITTPIAAVVTPDLDCPEKDEPLEVTRSKTGCNSEKHLACHYVEILGDAYPVEIFKDISEAKNEVAKGKKSAVVYIPDNYTSALIERLEKQAYATEWAVDHGTILVWADVSNVVSGFRVMEVIYNNLVKLLQEICVKCKIDLRLSRIPVAFQDPIYGDVNMKYITYLLPGIICPFVFYMTFMFTSTAMMMEKTSGQLERNQIAGLTLLEVVAAHVIIQFLVMCVQNFILFVVLYIIYDNVMIGSFSLVIILIFFCELIGMLLGILITMIMNKETLVAYIGIFTMLTTFTLCGSVWPMEGQYWLLQYMSTFMPLTHATKSYFSVSVRGWGFDKTWLGFLSSSVGVTVLSIVCYTIYKLKLVQM